MLQNPLTDQGTFNSELLKYAHGYALAFSYDSQQHVFGPDVVVTELPGFTRSKSAGNTSTGASLARTGHSWSPMFDSMSGIKYDASMSKPLIIDPEQQARNNLSHPRHFSIKFDFKFEDLNDNSFLILPLETLTKYMHQIVESCTKLRVVFVVHTGNAGNSAPNIDALLDKIVQFKAEKALLRKLMVVSTFHDIDRVLQAWRDGAQDNSIAEAWVDQDNLVIKTCAFERLEVGFDKAPWLSKIPARDRDKFDIDQFGRHIHWSIQDVHLNVDSVRCLIDKSFRTRRDIELIHQNRNFGRAIAAFRENKGLSQLTIQETSEITERQLRRVEREGHSLSVNMAEQLAQAHGLSTNEYLNAVARIAQELKTTPGRIQRMRI